MNGEGGRGTAWPVSSAQGGLGQEPEYLSAVSSHLSLPPRPGTLLLCPGHGGYKDGNSLSGEPDPSAHKPPLMVSNGHPAVGPGSREQGVAWRWPRGDALPYSPGRSGAELRGAEATTGAPVQLHGAQHPPATSGVPGARCRPAQSRGLRSPPWSSWVSPGPRVEGRRTQLRGMLGPGTEHRTLPWTQTERQSLLPPAPASWTPL